MLEPEDAPPGWLHHVEFWLICFHTGKNGGLVTNFLILQLKSKLKHVSENIWREKKAMHEQNLDSHLIITI